MTSRLFIREAGQREFVKQNGDYDSSEMAYEAGAELCRTGNVDAFEVWTMDGAYEREWTLRRADA